MDANATDLLIWLRGTGFAIACGVCLFGVALRLFEIFSLGRTPDLAPPREPTPGSGLRTVWTRSLPPKGMLRRAPDLDIVRAQDVASGFDNVGAPSGRRMRPFPIRRLCRRD